MTIPAKRSGAERPILRARWKAISILETVVAGFIDRFGWQRTKATAIEISVALILAVIICMGYNVLYFSIPLPNGTNAQILDLFDYVSNNVFMPVVAIGTCILIGWIIKPKAVIDEATKNGEKFRRKTLYIVMVKYIAPVLLIVLLLGSLGVIR